MRPTYCIVCCKFYSPETRSEVSDMTDHLVAVDHVQLRLADNRAHLPLEKDLIPMSSEAIEKLVDSTYDQFLSGDAHHTNLAKTSPAHCNWLLRLRDFSTVVEALRAMKEGDHGRLMYMWQQWSVMAQAMENLPHYSKHLPTLVVMIQHILPIDLSQLVLNTLLISPSGKTGQFMPTDQFLELQNYWLKYFFNHLGIGTDINRLKDVFSSNIPIVSFHFVINPLKINALMNTFSCATYFSLSN